MYRLAHKTNGWRKADPPRLLDYVNGYRKNFEDTQDGATKTDQFRRCVRYLRRWNDVRMPYEDEMKPTGLAYVLLAIQRGLAKRTTIDGRPEDRAALGPFVRALSNTFGRLKADKPTPEYEDILGRLDDGAMTQLKKDLGVLADALDAAGRTADPVEACTKRREVFGPDFPVPEPAESATAFRAPAIITSSTSA